HPHARRRRRHPQRAGIARPPQPRHHAGLHARDDPAAARQLPQGPPPRVGGWLPGSPLAALQTAKPQAAGGPRRVTDEAERNRPMTPRRLLPLVALAASLAAGRPARADGVEWRKDYGSALEEARAKGLPLVLDFGNDDCAWCDKLDA